MPQGDYQVEDVEASKQAPQDSSYKMCIITIGIFLLICIILLLCTLPLQSYQAASTDEYRADASESEHEISENGYQSITPTKRTTIAKYQQGTKAIEQLPPPVTPHYKVTQSDKGRHKVSSDDYTSITSTTISVLENSQEDMKENQLPSVTPHYGETENTKDGEVTLRDRSKTTANMAKESKATTPEYVLIHLKEDDKNNNNNRTTVSGTEEEVNSSVNSIPEVETKEQKYFTPTLNDDKYIETSAADENNTQASIMGNITQEAEDKRHVSLHTYGTTSGEEKRIQMEEKRNHKGLSTKPYQLGEDEVTVTTITKYLSSTSNEQGSSVKHIYVHEEKSASTTDGYTKHDDDDDDDDDEEEKHLKRTTFSPYEVEDNRTTSTEEVYKHRNSEETKPITVQTTMTTTITLNQMANKDSEPSTQSTVLTNQNNTNNENVSMVEKLHSHMEEETVVTDYHIREDEAEHQLTTPVADNNSTEDDKTGQENSTQKASEMQNDPQKQSDEKQNVDTKSDIHVTTLITENYTVKAITGDAVNLTDIKRTLQMTVTTDIPICILPNVTSNATRGNVCLTSKCKFQAKHLMKTMSFNVDACEDFYEFACGDVRTNKYLQLENLEQNTWNRIHSSMEKDTSVAGDKFKTFYNQCLHYDSIKKEERINQAIEILQSVGAFHNNTSWKTNPSNFTQLFLNMLQLHSAPLFDVLLDIDNTKGVRFDFQIIPPLSHSLFQDVAQTELQCKEDILYAYRNKRTFLLNTAYEDYMNCTLYPEDLLHKITEALENLSAFENLDEEENTSLVRLRQAIEFSILPCKRSLPNKREMLQKLLTKDFHNITVKELNSLYPLIEWGILLKGLLGKEVPADLVVQLYFKDYFDELFHNMETVEMYELHNAILALFAHDLYFNLVETKGACHRPSYCLKVASTLMQDVSSFLYLSSFTSNELQKFSRELQEISKKIKAAFKHIVEEEDTLMTAQIKIDQMEIITDGGMNVFGANGYMESLLNDVDIDDADGYLINAVKLTRRYRKKMYQLFFKNPRNYENIWMQFVHPYNFQPAAIYPLNMVVVPYGYLGTLQSYDPLMGYMRNVRLAIPLAQHMIHHFDTTGKTFNVSSLNYEMFEYCLDLSYSSQRSWRHPETKQIMDFKVDAPLFHNQRLTDFLALRTVLEAYKDEINSEKVLPWLDLNQEQIYFLIFTQSLCTKSDLLEDVISLFEDEYLPPTLRVADIMSNSEEFGTTYHCGVGIAMNPENKCKLFTTEDLASYMGSYEDVPKEQNANSLEVH